MFHVLRDGAGGIQWVDSGDSSAPCYCSQNTEERHVHPGHLPVSMHCLSTHAQLLRLLLLVGSWGQTPDSASSLLPVCSPLRCPPQVFTVPYSAWLQFSEGQALARAAQPPICHSVLACDSALSQWRVNSSCLVAWARATPAWTHWPLTLLVVDRIFATVRRQNIK